MRFKTTLLTASAGLALLLGGACAHAQGTSPLHGSVSSAEEGKMEGVVVSAKKDGGTITKSVVTNDKGEYSFPAGQLAPGHYTITIRAAGYDLDGKGAAEIGSGKSASADLKLKKTKNLALQLSSAEWIQSAPGTNQQKDFLSNCVGCHTVQRIFRSNHTADEFMQIFKRMSGYSPGSVPTHPQPTVGKSQRGFGSQELMQGEAKWLETINLSNTTSWEYPLKTLPRPKGKATHVLITEYDLPRAEAQPHDVVMTEDGHLWYSDFARQYVGELDPKTGKVADYEMPFEKKGFPTGLLHLDEDKDGNLWVAGMYQTGVFKFDRKAKKGSVFKLPDAWQKDHTQESMVAAVNWEKTGKVWTNNQDTHTIYQLDPKTGEYKDLGVQTDAEGHKISAYGIPADNENGIYLLEFGGTHIGHVDPKTLKVSIYPTPSPASRPRRGHVDPQDRLWFAEYRGNAIAMFDPKTKAIKEWQLPTAFSDPYDAQASNDGKVAWTASMLTDQVDRLDVKSGTYTEYLLPHYTNIRRVFVAKDDSLWVGNNHGAAIVHVQPLD